VQAKRWRETLPNGVDYEILDVVDDGPLDNTAIFDVPAGSLFVLGDNRGNAQDSRLPKVGFVPIGDVNGYVKPPADRASPGVRTIARGRGGQAALTAGDTMPTACSMGLVAAT